MVDVTFVRPAFTAGDAERIARDQYGVVASASPLPSERDQNYLLNAADGRRFVLKIATTTEDLGVLDLQNQALLHLADHAPALALPRLVATTGRMYGALEPDGAGRPHMVRLLTWVPGRVLADVRPHTPELLRSLGSLVGRIDRALASFTHPAADRSLKWDPKRARWIQPFFAHVASIDRRTRVERLHAWSDDELDRLGPGLPESVIYNDANDHNVIVEGDDPYARRVSAVIDFGDMLRSWTVNDLAVAAAYAMLDKPDPLHAAAAIVAGYHAERPLSDAELDALLPLIVRRLCVSVVNSAYQQQVEPGNDYLVISERPAWDLLERMATLHPRFAAALFRDACGLVPSPTGTAVAAWLREYAGLVGPLLEPDPASVERRHLDLSIGSLEAGPWTDVEAVSRHIRGLIRASNAGIGIGRHDEARMCYTADAFRVAGNDGPEWRTVHLGVDLFVEPGTHVLAPLDGVVRGVGDSGEALGHGPTVILEHAVTAESEPDQRRFCTLYGHLSRDVLSTLREGQAVARGESLGRVGTAYENGGWAPHLHFQIVADPLDYRSDFPGVARPSERRVWLSLCPDPNLIARLPEGVTAPRHPDTDALLARRREHLGPSLSLSYRRPLTIVRGSRQHLYDADGCVYLDAVNNVPHVGHCHPRVVEAGQRQMAVLNTNTRYLHETIARYASRLCETLPEPLRVCYFVNSGSEANELALRLARAATGRRETIVVEAGYHGNTTTIVDISSYKFDGPGGAGAPPWVFKVPAPDTYRGLYRSPDREAGRRYAASVSEAVARITSGGGRVGAFIAESILSCGGQIVLPPGYLAGAYDAVREAGGVCIADEVQVGLGRAGTHFWAFEAQGVVPDIVTMGKPLGNGHPLGAVVTTRAIAEAFANGMEYFNTFGGNPVSCAIGLAVLDVVRDEQLQANALDTGAHLLSALRGLGARHPLVGDVRGLGLFVGVEFVRDRSTLEPADIEAGTVVNRMRDRGVLVSTDGPLHNVIKIKPPMVFTRADANRLVAAMDEALAELP